MRRMYSENQLESIIKSQVEGGTLENAKPIYYHPIYCYGKLNGNEKLTFQCAILNNSSTPLNSQATLWSELKRLTDLGALININGFIVDETKYKTAFILYKGTYYQIDAFTENGKTEGIRVDTIFEDEGFSAYVTDGVNKIN